MSVRPYEVELAVVRARDYLARVVFRPPVQVTVGTDPRCAVALPDAPLPEFMDLVRLDREGALLRLDSGMEVEFDVGSGIRKTPELISTGLTREDRDGHALPLPLGSKGLVTWGDVRLMVKVAAPRPAPVRSARGGTPAACGECGTHLVRPVLSPGALNPCQRCGTLNRVEAPELARELGNTVHALRIPRDEPPTEPRPQGHRVGPADTQVATNEVPALLLADAGASPGQRTPVELEGLRTVPQMAPLSVAVQAPSEPPPRPPLPPPLPPRPSVGVRSRSLLFDEEEERPTPPNVPLPSRANAASIGPVDPTPYPAAERNADLPVFEPLSKMKPPPGPSGGKRAADLPTFDGISQLRAAPPPTQPRVVSRPDQVVPAARFLASTTPPPPRDRSPAAHAATTPASPMTPLSLQPALLRPPPGPSARPVAELPSQDAITALRDQGLSTQAAIAAMRGGEDAEPPILRSAEVQRFEPIRGATAALDSLPEADAAARGEPAAVRVGGARSVVPRLGPPPGAAAEPAGSPVPSSAPPQVPAPQAGAVPLPTPGPTVAVPVVPPAGAPRPTIDVPSVGRQAPSTRIDDDGPRAPATPDAPDAPVLRGGEREGRLYVIIGCVCGSLGLALLVYALLR